VNGYFRAIVESNMSQPKAIVVDPALGLIFWSDWANDAKIERAGMNGRDRMVRA
jgi:hypothetical protein